MIGWGLVIEGGFLGMLVLGDLRSQVPAFFLCYGGAALGYTMGIWHYRAMPLWVIVGFGVVFRLTVFDLSPSLSDDIYRYVWDGKMQFFGINPFRFAPMAKEVAHLRDAVIFPNINHAELPTIYPPVAQGLFLLGYVVQHGVWGMKAVVVMAEGAIVFGVVRVLKLMGGNVRALLIYWWHPLVVVEGAGSGHIDLWGVALLLWAVYFVMTMHGKKAFVFLGGAVLVKFLPLVAWPLLMRLQWDWIRRHVGLLLIFPLIVGLGYVPYAWTGAPVLGSLGIYAENWEFNSPVFDLLRTFLNDGQLSRKILWVGFVVWVMFLVLKRLPPLRGVYFTLAGFLLVTPTLHPWYALWLIPFLVFYRHPAWIVFTLVLPLSYHVLIEYERVGVWQEAMWVRYVEFGALIGTGLVWKFWRQKMTSINRGF